MVSVTHAAHDIEVTTESLQEDLARLKVQKQALERELAAVIAHLHSVQRALGAFQALMSPSGAASSGTAPRAVAHVEQLPDSPAVDPADAAARSGRATRDPESTAVPEEHGPAPESSDEAERAEEVRQADRTDPGLLRCSRRRRRTRA